MKWKALIAIALLALPSAAAATCGGHAQSAASCPAGQVWDGESQQCISGASS